MTKEWIMNWNKTHFSSLLMKKECGSSDKIQCTFIVRPTWLQADGAFDRAGIFIKTISSKSSNSLHKAMILCKSK